MRRTLGTFSFQYIVLLQNTESIKTQRCMYQTLNWVGAMGGGGLLLFEFYFNCNKESQEFPNFFYYGGEMIGRESKGIRQRVKGLGGTIPPPTPQFNVWYICICIICNTCVQSNTISKAKFI